MTPACHASRWDNSSEGDPTSVSPSSVRRCAHRWVGPPRALSSLFQSNQAEPSTSTKRLGSMEPPLSSWKTNGPVDESTNGPAGDELTANDTHWRPERGSRTA